MAIDIKSGRIQFQRGTADNWVKSNLILLDGEVGIESDTGMFKIGDGKSPYNRLEYPKVFVGGSGGRGPAGPPGPPGPPGKDGADVPASLVDELNSKINSLLKRVEALEKGGATSPNPSPKPILPGGDEPSPKPTNPEPPKAVDNSAYPVITDKNDFYFMDTIQAVKLYYLVDIARYNITKINNTLSKTKLGTELGISGISSATMFQSSKAYRIAYSYIQANNPISVKDEVAAYVSEANG